MPRRIARSKPFKGIDLSTAKVRMDSGAAQASINMDYDRQPGASVRPGRAKLLDGAGAVVLTSEAPTRLLAFARADDDVMLMLALDTSVNQVTAGESSW